LILDDLAHHARERPDARAVVGVGAQGTVCSTSWGELSAGVDRAAARLLSLGVSPGEPVAFQLPNRLDFVTIALATLRIGAVCEPLMPIFRERELAFMLRESAARVLFVPDAFRGRDHAALAAGLAAQLDELEHVVVLDGGDWTAGAVTDDDALRARRPDGEATAQLLFTSGSTGEPKGVLHRHDVLDRAADAHIAHFGLRGDEVIYIPSPLAHQTGFLYGMWIALRLGATQVIQEAWDAELGYDTVQRFGVTFVQAATPFLADLTRIARERDEPPRALRRFVATGAAVPRELAREARAVLEAEVGGGFGTTESCMGAGFLTGVDDERAWTTDGCALANVRLRIVDDEGRELAPGAEGNFEILTDTLFEGYLNRPDLTAEALSADGWYRPGDLAVIDADGYLRITGRVKDVINRGGEKVPVAEIEQLLHRHPAVADVAIVAMPDARLGERACAFVVSAPGIPELEFATMQEYLDDERVAKTYWPERLELVSELPRTPSGKIQKFLLREQAARLAERKAIAT
jgi:3-phosphoshikimate 1-carboxyvinyltransferase